MLYRFRTYTTNILRSNLFFGYMLCSNYRLLHSRWLLKFVKSPRHRKRVCRFNGIDIK